MRQWSQKQLSIESESAGGYLEILVSWALCLDDVVVKKEAHTDSEGESKCIFSRGLKVLRKI